MKRLVFRVSPTAPSSGAQKLGQPVWLSYFVVDEKRSRLQPAQTNTPARCSLSNGLEPGRSVLLCRSTAYCSGVSSLCHSASLWVTAKGSAMTGEQRNQVSAKQSVVPAKR